MWFAVVAEPSAGLLVREFVAKSLLAPDGVRFAAFVLDLDKVRLTVEECALVEHLGGSNLEHLQF